MIRPNEIALTPASLATDGEQGEGAKTIGPCRVKDSPLGCATLFLAVVAMDAAREQLTRYALASDEPALGVVDAADLLDAARAAMAQAVKP